MWITLKVAENESIAVNFDHVKAMVPRGDRTELRFADGDRVEVEVPFIDLTKRLANLRDHMRGA